MNNPAVYYRTQTEILGLQADKQPVTNWLHTFLPHNWHDIKGLWYTYHLTAIAECGLTRGDVSIDESKALDFGGFECGCADFMKLRALVMLGYGEDERVINVLIMLKSLQLPDGGFLCINRLYKREDIPKSCVKANNWAIMLCGECSKTGIDLEITELLVDYYRKHRLFYRSDSEKLMIDAREGWRTTDTFHPPETMRVGLHNIVEALSALGYGSDKMMSEAWQMLDRKADADGCYLLDGTLTKSYLPKEKAGKPSDWVTFYAMLAKKHLT